MADFTKASGNSMKGVELIAVIHNGRTVPKKTKDGKDTNEIGARFVDVMVDNSSLTTDDIKAGKGQTDPNLYSRKVTYTDKTTGEPKEGYDNGIRFSENQVDAIKAAGGANILTKEDGTMYVPFKADLMNLKMATRDEAGNVIKDDKGAAVKKTVGLMPNIETLVPSDRGPLTQERLDAHFENTRAANAVAKAAKALGLKHAVVTSVTRDDLKDGGASHFAATIRAIQEISPETTVEVLIPDLKGDENALNTVLDANPDVLNHNVETVKELYSTVRPQAIYARSLEVLRYCKIARPDIRTKTGFMVGLGETDEQITELMRDIYATGCDILTIGQYLRPSKEHAELKRYVTPEQFDEYKKTALKMGFKFVASSPLARSSYKAFEALQASMAENE